MKKSKTHADAALIDRLGGPAEVARRVNAKTQDKKRPLSSHAVSMWRKRGVSVYFRNVFAEVLKDKGHEVPEGFTDSKHRGW